MDHGGWRGGPTDPSPWLLQACQISAHESLLYGIISLMNRCFFSCVIESQVYDVVYDCQTRSCFFPEQIRILFQRPERLLYTQSTAISSKFLYAIGRITGTMHRVVLSDFSVSNRQHVEDGCCASSLPHVIVDSSVDLIAASDRRLLADRRHPSVLMRFLSSDIDRTAERDTSRKSKRNC